MIHVPKIPTSAKYIKQPQMEVEFAEPCYYDDPFSGSIFLVEEAKENLKVKFRFKTDILYADGTKDISKFIKGRAFESLWWNHLEGKTTISGSDYTILIHLIEDWIEDYIVPILITETVENILSENQMIWEQVGHS